MTQAMIDNYSDADKFIRFGIQKDDFQIVGSDYPFEFKIYKENHEQFEMDEAKALYKELKTSNPKLVEKRIIEKYQVIYRKDSPEWIIANTDDTKSESYEALVKCMRKRLAPKAIKKVEPIVASGHVTIENQIKSIVDSQIKESPELKSYIDSKIEAGIKSYMESPEFKLMIESMIESRMQNENESLKKKQRIE